MMGGSRPSEGSHHAGVAEDFVIDTIVIGHAICLSLSAVGVTIGQEVLAAAEPRPGRQPCG